MEIEKREDWLQKINSSTNGKLETFLLDNNLCPLCASSLLKCDGETVCPNCGFVPEQMHFDNRTPFGISNKPTKEIEFEKGLGDTLGLTGLRALAWKTLEKKPFKCSKQGCGYEGPYVCPRCGAEQNDYPIRANQLAMSAQNFEHPKLRTLKKFISLRAKDFGFDKRDGDGKETVFTTRSTKIAKNVAAHLIFQNARTSWSKLADTCVALTLLELEGEGAFEVAKKKMCLEDRWVRLFTVIYETHARKV